MDIYEIKVKMIYIADFELTVLFEYVVMFRHFHHNKTSKLLDC